MTDLTTAQQELIDLLPTDKTYAEIGDELGLTKSGVESRKSRINEDTAYQVFREDGVWQYDAPDAEVTTDDFEWGVDDGEDTDDDPDPNDLTERETYLVRELQTGTTKSDLADDLDVRPRIVDAHFDELEAKGWDIYHDEDADLWAIEGEHTLRSSEHKGTRTRKANRWWELRHNELVREYKRLQPPTATSDPDAGTEDWVLHLTDLHAGDEVRGYDDALIHTTEELPGIIDYITEKALALADKHNATYDTGYILWGGDAVTNEAIYSGQFEHLDSWLDEQIDVLHDPLLRQIKGFADRFNTVRVVCTPGNHGDIRASGSSQQANADLILYKSLRNTVATLQQEGLLEHVGFTIGRAGTPTPFSLRGGKLHGHLRHGQDRSPQADTSARKKEWLSTLLDSMHYGQKFDIAWMGHHHLSGRLPWNGPPVIISGSPKPAGEYPRELGESVGPTQPDIATCHGLSDDGLTSVWPIDGRHFDS